MAKSPGNTLEERRDGTQPRVYGVMDGMGMGVSMAHHGMDAIPLATLQFAICRCLNSEAPSIQDTGYPLLSMSTTIRCNMYDSRLTPVSIEK